MMNSRSIWKIIALSLIFFIAVPVCEAYSFGGPVTSEQQKNVSKKPVKHKKIRITGPKSAKKAQKKADQKDKKLKKDYDKFVKENQKRSIEIQTPEVKERMKQNVKNSNANYKAKKKSNAARSKKAGKKYR